MNNNSRITNDILLSIDKKLDSIFSMLSAQNIISLANVKNDFTSKDFKKMGDILNNQVEKYYNKDNNEDKNMTMINKKTWDEFRDTGLLWFINTILHAFGWAITIDADRDESGNLINEVVYPARVKFRGFSSDINDRGYEKVTDYILNNAEELWNEVNADD